MFNGVRCYSLRGWVGTDHHCAATLQEFIEGAAKLRGSAKKPWTFGDWKRRSRPFLSHRGIRGGTVVPANYTSYGCTNKSPHRTRMSPIVDLIGFNGI